MKKTMIAAIVFILSLGLCTGVYADTGLIVFAAASMTETLNEIKALYEEEKVKNDQLTESLSKAQLKNVTVDMSDKSDTSDNDLISDLVRSFM
jgi:ABC-type molybdate transport system substrate-binding protein